MHSEIPVLGFLNELQFLTKNYDVGSLLACSPRDCELMTDEDKELLAERIAKSLRIFDERFRVLQYLVRRRVQDSVLYEQQSFMVILRLASHNDVKPSFLPSRTMANVRKTLQERSAALELSVASWIENCSSFWPCRLAQKQEAFRLMCLTANYGVPESSRLTCDQFLDFQLGSEDVSFGRGEIVLGEKSFSGEGRHVKVLTLKNLPRNTEPGILSRLYGLDCEFTLLAEAQPISIAKQPGMLHRAKKNQIAQEHGAITPTTLVEASHRDQAALSRVSQIGQAEIEVEQQNYLCTTSITIAVHSCSQQETDKAAGKIKAAMNAVDCGFHVEGINRQSIFFSMIPGGYKRSFRQLAVHNTNVADFSTCFGVDQGNPRNEHLGKECLGILETAQSTPYYLNLHAPDVAHSLVLGRTGAGKSFLVSYLIDQLQKYRPYTLIFDLGGSFEFLTKTLGGAYTQVQFQGSNVKINPFCLAPSRQQFNFLTLLVSVLIEQRGARLSGEDEDDIYQSILKLYNQERRTLSALVEILPEKLRRQLRRWVGEGQYSWLLDNEEDNVSLAEFQCFDFAGMEKYPDILEPLFLYVFHRADRMIHDGQPERLKAFVADEAWVFLRNPKVANYLMEALKTWRKRNAFVLLSTQSASELERSEIWDVIAECCATKFFLWNPGMDEKTYADLFHLNPVEIKAIRTIMPKRDFLFKTPFTSKVLSLKMPASKTWIYSNDPKTNAKREEAIKQYGSKWIDALCGDGADGAPSAVEDCPDGVDVRSGHRDGVREVSLLDGDCVATRRAD